MNTRRSDFLMSKGSFWAGVGSSYGLFGDYFVYNCSPSAEEADSTAIGMDWKIVGDDLRRASATLQVPTQLRFSW